MKPVTRGVIVVLVVIVIAILYWLWNQRGQQSVPPDDGVVQQTQAPMPPAVPAAPKVVEPVSASVLFDYNRSVIRATEVPKLEEMSAKFKDPAFDRIDAIGHTDRIGSDAYNMQLSTRRAEAVQAYLAGKGVDAAKIRTDAMGKSEAVTGEACRKLGADNRKNRKLIECLQPDRRVQITLVPKR